MNTILVLTDYSEVARNAANYAISLAGDIDAKKIVFYNAYQAPPVLTETTVPAMPLMDIDTMRSISENGMIEFKRQLLLNSETPIQMEHITQFSNLANDIDEICQSCGAEFIVMGITGTSKIEEVLIGSTSISVMKQTKVPVIVVPVKAKYTSIKNVMLACNFKNVVETIPIQPIKTILNATGAKLFVVNVYENDKEITADKNVQQELLQSLLLDYKPEFKYESNESFIEGINHFVKTNNIDFILTVPRKHRLFEGLFNERHTKMLAFHSAVPLMFIHQEDLS